MGREFELKYAASPAAQAKIREQLGAFTPISMETVYYDTTDGALAGRHITLRTRRENGIAVCTVKTPAADGSRGEWELPGEEITAAIPELCKLGAPEVLRSLTASGVQAVCGARFTRLARTLVLEDCTVEIALDSGMLMGGGREKNLCEVEVELKEGSTDGAVAYARALAAAFGLIPESRSKFRRALALARGEDNGI